MIIDLVAIFSLSLINLIFPSKQTLLIRYIGLFFIHFSYIGLSNYVFFPEAGLKNYLNSAKRELYFSFEIGGTLYF